MQMVPILPPNIKEQTGEDYDKHKINAAFLTSKKEKNVYNMLN